MKLFSKLSIALVSLGLMVGAAACGSDSGLPTVDCNTQTPVPYAQVTLLTDTCSGCHAATLSGTERNGAPASINFDQYDSAKANSKAAVSAVYGGSMPPGGEQVPDAMAQQLYVWALCGTPQ